MTLESESAPVIGSSGIRRRIPSRQRPARSRRRSGLRVALLAPPWIPVPPPGYGGIELVIAELAGGLVRRGHDVALLAPPGSRSSARVIPLLERDHSNEIGETLYDVDYVARALEVIAQAAARGRPFDIVHDHSGFTSVAIADQVGVPVLHTLHGPFNHDTRAFYRRHADKVWISGLTQAQLATAPAGLRCVAQSIPNPISVSTWPLQREKEEYLLWVGPMAPEKGPHRAIAAARRADRPLILGGPVQPGQQEFFDAEVAPPIDGEAVRYGEEIRGSRKRELFAKAATLLMPIRWREPFGMVMIEAMACGTPVIAFREASTPEVVSDGVSGFLVENEVEMADSSPGSARLTPSDVALARASGSAWRSSPGSTRRPSDR